MSNGLIGQVGDVASSSLQAMIAKIKADAQTSISTSQLRDRLNKKLLDDLNRVNAPDFDPDKIRQQNEKTGDSLLGLQQRGNEVERQRLQGLTPIRGEMIQQNTGADISRMDARTRNIKDIQGQEIDYRRWQQGKSDADMMQDWMTYASGENEKNRQLRETAMNRGLIGQLIGSLLTGAAIFAS